MTAAAVAVLMAVGLVGTVVPVLPGLPVIWAAAFMYGVAGGFGTPGIVAMSLITVLLIAGTGAKYVLAHRGATGAGATRSTILAGALVGFVGFFVVPVVGFVLGAVLGILLAERVRLGDWKRAYESSRQVLSGFGIGLLLEVAAGLVMIVCWLAWVIA
jgi:uncharacterized protein YqgC (DUF456 family)